MSTIACDGTRAAADSASFEGNMRTENVRTKLRKVDGYLFGCVGTICVFDHMIKWWLGGAKRENYPKFSDEHATVPYTFLIFLKDKALMYSNESNLEDDRAYPCAFGSGSDYAIAVMKATSDASQAVQIACTLDAFSAQPVEHHDVPDILSTAPRPPKHRRARVKVQPSKPSRRAASAKTPTRSKKKTGRR